MTSRYTQEKRRRKIPGWTHGELASSKTCLPLGNSKGRDRTTAVGLAWPSSRTLPLRMHAWLLVYVEAGGKYMNLKINGARDPTSWKPRNISHTAKSSEWEGAAGELCQPFRENYKLYAFKALHYLRSSTSFAL